MLKIKPFQRIILIITCFCYVEQLLVSAFPIKNDVFSFQLSNKLSFSNHPNSSRAQTSSTTTTSPTALFMGSFNKRRNKQAELMKKMELAKKQKRERENDGEGEQDATSASTKMTSDEIKARNDRKRFDELLNRESVTHMSELGGGSYLTSKQEEEDMDAAFTGVDRLFEGDPAAIQPFEDLIHFKSEKAIGKVGTDRLLPWRKKISSKDYIICICDPREKSIDLRKAMRTLPGKMKGKKLIFVSPDSPAENRRWVKKNEVEDANIYSDEKREWMRAYTALGSKRWSMTLFILADGRVQKIIRELDPDLMDTAIRNAISSMTI